MIKLKKIRTEPKSSTSNSLISCRFENIFICNEERTNVTNEDVIIRVALNSKEANKVQLL